MLNHQVCNIQGCTNYFELCLEYHAAVSLSYTWKHVILLYVNMKPTALVFNHQLFTEHLAHIILLQLKKLIGFLIPSLHQLGLMIRTNQPSKAHIAPTKTPLDLFENPALTLVIASLSSRYLIILVSPI